MEARGAGHGPIVLPPAGNIDLYATTRDRIVAHLPPPLLFLAAFLAGIGIETVVPLGRRLTRFTGLTHPLGVALLAAGLILACVAIATFAAVRTTVFPHGSPSRLVTSGPYRFTRNPMYVSLTVTYLGAASTWQFLWPVILLPLPLLWIERLLIPIEERRLTDAFGDTYRAYCRRVRRWL